MSASIPWISFAVPALAAVVSFRRRADRARIRATWGFIVLWVAAALCAEVSALFGQDTKLFSEVGRAFLELAILNVGTILAFDYALSRLRMPKLAGEVVLVAGFLAVIFRLLTRLGSDVTGLIATSAVATAVIGFALQDMLANVVGGAMLELEGGIQPGDWIRAADVYGCIRHVRLRHTEVLTGDGDTVFIPNSVLTRGTVTRVKRSRRTYVPFIAPYSSSVEVVQSAVERALTTSPLFGIAEEPRPKCVVKEFAQTYISYAAVVWLTEPGQETSIISGVLSRVYHALARRGIQVGEISQLIELRRNRPEDVPSRALQVLRSTPLFRLLDQEDLLEVAGRMKPESYAPGEFIIRQGDQGGSMFFITSGECSVVLAGADNGLQAVASLGPGDFFGETSLLTGEFRNASVAAAEAVQCFTLDSQGLQDLMKRRPEIAEDMAVVAAHRAMELEGARERLDRESARERANEREVQLLTRIRRFFGIQTESRVAGR